MLLALYEKSTLRNDTKELLKVAKEQNIFVIAVNTLKLKAEEYPDSLVDVYIERENFGRDFGSYQAGMKYIYENKIDTSCERLLIINDSVFFSLKNLSAFIYELFNSKTEVLGATENSQHSHHLGSFCISVNGDIVRNERFKNYWYGYKLSNVRPLVIKRGEFALSKLLKSLASSEQNFKSIFNISFMEDKLKNDANFFNHFFYYRREGERAWYNQSITSLFKNDEVLRSYYSRFVQNENFKKYEFKLNFLEKNKALLPSSNLSYDLEEKELKNVDYLEVIKFFEVENIEKNPDLHILKQRLIYLYLDEFTLGSQIHINCLALHHVGLPIIKLDLIFRCVCNLNDIIKLRDQLDESQRDDFMTLMTSRLCGDRFLVGLDRLAYQHGIL
ncbi:hypothetical protein O3W44_19075 [Pantoea sp. LMR881]|uniref:rhamnan synthesis F family protein n=1 Tax=Pantoea sp. LMR881 TaxID=3014336 RepID=UPI0022B01794|nr:rhamnan synthesis F family protein [Pantoea sp. LMR881]MCZ4060746.1 hypothetical protein [Pantoea sp. LMR881]